MNILFVQKVKALVGSENYFLELLPALEQRGHQTEFICIYSKADKEKTLPFIEAFDKLGLKIHVLAIPSDKHVLKCIRFINTIVKKGTFDLVHSHLIHADLWCALLKKMKRIKCPLVSTKHGYDETYISKHGFSAKELQPNRYYKICKFSERYIDRSFAVSEGLRQLFIASGISDERKISTIHHGFDLPDLHQKKDSSFRFSAQQLVILGRVIPFKGHRHLLNALLHVKPHFPNFKLIVLGHGDHDLLDELHAFCDTNKLTENVSFLGYQSNKYDYLVNSDVMIVPSIAEGFGLIFLEALNAKIPIIGFDVPATNEILIDQKTGILIPPYDTKAMGEAIVKLLANKQQAVAYAENGFDRLKTHFSLDRMTTATIDFYEQALSESVNTGKKV